MTTVYDGWYLIDYHRNRNKPSGPASDSNTRPWYTTRRATVTGIVIHTPETLEDFTAPYDEAERIAKYGATTTRASWHDTIDADSIIPMLPPQYTAWHVRGYNSETIGMEIGAKATSWNRAPAEWVTGVLTNAAIRARQHALHFDIPIRFVTRAQLDAGTRGFTSHAQLDPTRRTDPGADFPWDRFLNLVRGGDDDMTPEQEKFLNEMIASAKAVGTNGHFVKPTVELVRAHGGIVSDLRRQITELATSAGGTVDQTARSAVQSLREHLRRS